MGTYEMPIETGSDWLLHTLLIHCDGRTSTTPLIVRWEGEILLGGFYKALELGAGPCRMCKKCTPEKSVQPKHTLPAMEVCGIDVHATARANRFPIKVLPDHSAEENCYGLALIE